MKTLGIAMLLGMGLALVGCGTDSSNKSGNVNGNWTATLSDGGGTQMFAFTTSLVATGTAGTLTVNNFRFSTDSACFVSGETETGSFALSGDFTGNVSGQLGMSIQSGSPGGNNLILSGKVSGNTIRGTWTLAGSPSCTGSGSFTMSKM